MFPSDDGGLAHLSCKTETTSTILTPSQDRNSRIRDAATRVRDALHMRYGAPTSAPNPRHAADSLSDNEQTWEWASAEATLTLTIHTSSIFPESIEVSHSLTTYSDAVKRTENEAAAAEAARRREAAAAERARREGLRALAGDDSI